MPLGAETVDPAVRVLRGDPSSLQLSHRTALVDHRLDEYPPTLDGQPVNSVGHENLLDVKT